jgi:uncharacterized protein (TIGR03067 family)
MKKLIVAVACLALIHSARSADKKSKALTGTHQGVWKPIAATMNGQRLPKAELDKITVTIKGNEYVVTVVGEDHDDQGTFTVDNSVKPHRMTIKSHAGPNKGKTFLAIFEHKHGDAMRVCYDLSGKEFPKVFRTKKGSPYYAVGYRRQKD